MQFVGARRQLNRTLRENVTLLVALVLVVAGVLFIIFTIPIFRVLTGSMEPRLPVGSVIFEASADTLEPGDIITFREPDQSLPTTHAFIGYASDGSLITKGDANSVLDTHAVPLTHDEVVGKVVLELPLLVPSFWLSQKGLLIITLAMMSSLSLWRWKWVKKIDSEPQARQEPLEPLMLLHDESRELSPV
ncbi:MAG: signal peptidase I [Candidatus Saccharimonadaceae bacterium]